ncbi:MAG: LacI family DNA-binding transcriptional regulator [Saccharofermentanales bacterium]
MSTIKEVAESAKVSVATVSRVINDDPVVKLSTRMKVQAAIGRLNYTPNLLGRNLRQVRTDKILVLIPSISNQFYSKIISAMERTAKSNGYRVLVCMTHNDPSTEREYIDMLTTRVVDGIIFLSSGLSAEEMNSLAAAYPVVQCCEYIDGSDTDTVIIDNEQAAYDAVTCLLDQGHRSVAFFGSMVKYTSGILRERGYQRALADRIQTGRSTIPCREYIFLDDYSYPGGQRMAAEYLGQMDRPDAVFCISDSIAIGCIRELTDRGLHIPDEVAVMGFDDTSVAKVFCPAISTVAQPQEETGIQAMELLLDRIRKTKSPSRTRILPHRLVFRETTKAPAQPNLSI